MKILKHVLTCLFRVFYCFIIFLLALLAVLSLPDFMAKKIEQLVNVKLPQGTRINGLSFSRIGLSLRAFSLDQVHLTFERAQKQYTVFADGVFLFDATCLATYKECRLTFEKLSVKSTDLKIVEAWGDLMISMRAKQPRAKGSVAVDSFSYKEYEIADLYSDLEITGKGIIFERASAKAYQGRITAEGQYEFSLDERIKVALDFKGIDTHTIHGVNNQWKGVVEGKVLYAGTWKRIESLTAEFRSPFSEMERTVLKFLIGDVGNALAFLPFAKILEGTDFIHLDKFQGKVHNLDDDSVVVQLNLESRQLNLNLNPDITIHLR